MISEWSRNEFFFRHLDRLDGGNSSTPLDGEYAFNAAAGGTCKCRTPGGERRHGRVAMHARTDAPLLFDACTYRCDHSSGS